MAAPQKVVRLAKPKTRKGARVLEAREPQLVETLRKALLLYGSKVSQVTKEVLTEINKLKAKETVRYTRKNGDILPFEAGGETRLEHFAAKTDCGAFVLATHTKKRQHNLIFGRFYDYRLYDLLELGVEQFHGSQAFGNASTLVQEGNKPCFVFMGDKFESSPQHRLAKGLLLDVLRGRHVDAINLKGLDHVIVVTAQDSKLLFRQYAIQLKKSGTKVPRVELQEMGPSMDFVLRRFREAAPDLAKEAHRQPKLAKKKEKNVSRDMLDGKVGRIYMPRQELGTIALQKMKGSKRAHELESPAEEAQVEAAAPKKQKNKHLTD